MDRNSLAADPYIKVDQHRQLREGIRHALPPITIHLIDPPAIKEIHLVTGLTLLRNTLKVTMYSFVHSHFKLNDKEVIVFRDI